MLEQHRVERKITHIFCESLNYEPPGPEADLFEEGGLDSMMFVELLAELEQAFDMEIPLEELELEDFASIRHIAGFIAARAGNPDPGQTASSDGELRRVAGE